MAGAELKKFGNPPPQVADTVIFATAATGAQMIGAKCAVAIIALSHRRIPTRTVGVFHGQPLLTVGFAICAVLCMLG